MITSVFSSRKRKEAGDTCSGFGQCVDKAECTSRNGGLCLCVAGYFQLNGLCHARKDEGQPCK